MLSDYLILTGTALNYYGAVSGLFAISSDSKNVSNGYFILQKLFLTGVAATLGSLYLYVFFRPTYIVPFQGFGAALK